MLKFPQLAPYLEQINRALSTTTVLSVSNRSITFRDRTKDGYSFKIGYGFPPSKAHILAEALRTELGAGFIVKEIKDSYDYVNVRVAVSLTSLKKAGIEVTNESRS